MHLSRSSRYCFEFVIIVTSFVLTRTDSVIEFHHHGKRSRKSYLAMFRFYRLINLILKTLQFWMYCNWHRYTLRMYGFQLRFIARFFSSFFSLKQSSLNWIQMEMIVTITLIRLLFKSNKHEFISDQARGEDATCMLFDRNLKERVTLKHCK